ncbi:MAG: hypothetical protein ACKOZU_04890 [Planctomycetaceae bacterium]
MTARRIPSSRPAAALLTAYAACWLAVVSLPPVAFLRWREARLVELSGGAAQADWDRFRDDMRAQADGPGPVRRKVPRSAEPPELIWLRDYPSAVVAAWVIFVGLLGAVVGLMLRGAMRGALPRTAAADDATGDLNGRGSAAP